MLTVSSYRPGATEAVAAATTYHAVSSSSCVNGVWTPAAAALMGVVYVPCAVSLTAGTLDATVTIAAEGTISLGVAGARLVPAARSGAVLVSGGDLHVSGDNVQMLGSVFSAAGVKLTGARQTLFCGAVGRTVQVSGADFTAGVGGSCVPR